MPCYKPFQVTDANNVRTFVPCGKCPDCYKRRISGWSFRLMNEDRYSDNSYFITLTYDRNSCPITSKGYMGLRKRDLQLFIKRLRKRHTRAYRIESRIARLRGKPSLPGYKPIKYYAVGEYGGKSYRPHYHILLFNVRVELIQDAWGIEDKKHKVTHIGQVHYGFVSGASVGYTLKYMCKPSRVPLHANDDRIPEFSLMSKGIGKGYLSPQMIAWHKADLFNRCCLTLTDGRKVAMPRYYKSKIYTSEEKGILKGYFEQKRIYDAQVATQQGRVPTQRDWDQAVKAGFRKLYYSTQQNRQTV